MADPFVAEIRMFAFNFPPTGWAFCDGQLLPLSQNTALFSLVGTYYGGDGKVTFALPNLQGDAAIHPGQGPGLSLYSLGESGGSPNVTLLTSEMPAHNHTLVGDEDDGGFKTVQNMIFAGGNQMYITGANPTGSLALQALTPTGGSQPHNNMMPYLALNFCIALQGVFPPRS